MTTRVVAFLLLIATSCGSNEGGTASNATGGAHATGGGAGLVDASFGGAPGGGSDGGGSGGSAATGGSAASGGAGAGGASGSSAGTGGAAITCAPNDPLDCSDPNATDWSCADQPQNYGNVLGQAIQQVLADHPDWFDTSNGIPCCPIALDPPTFIGAVVAAVNAGGLCSTPSPLNPSIEVVVKKNNGCEESWAVLTSANVVRNPPHHQSTCTALH